MADNKKTIFQRLNTIFDASGVDLTKLNQNVNKYSIGNEVLLKTQSKEEYEAAKLQAQQTKFLGGVWRKTENELIQHSMHYETTRIGSYADFESMEFYPEIAAALDIMMEECLAGSTIIPLLNGSELTMKEIYDNNLTDFWVYSVDLETNKIKPSKVEKAILKGTKKVFKITLDDDTELLCTDNHKWLRYDNTWVETKDLLFGDSLRSTIGNHRVLKVEYYGEEEVYDLVNSSVSQNFAIKCNNGLVISHNCTTVNSKGRVLNVHSESKRIQGILEDLFFNRLDLHASLPMWTRNICKYGDNFLLLNIDDKKGIIGARQLPNFEIERREGDIVQNQYSGQWTVNNEGEDAKVKFMWRGRDMEFNSWQIAHFRLLGDDRRLPYGSSMLEKARRIWKQLQLSEDAMLVYRVTRAPERRVYKIYVGNIDEKDVPQYVDEIANRFKRKPVIDPQTGQIDLRYNQLANDQDYFIPVRDENAATPIDTLQGACIALDTRIPLLDGRVLELNQIINEWDNGNRDLWVYSCNPSTGELAPGMITWAGETRKDTEVIKITLDNGESITTTPDHKWVHRTKGFVEAKDLIIGDSLMPFYRDRKKIKSNTNGDYERIWDSAKQEWVFTHRMVTDLLNDFNVIENFTFNEKYSNEIKNIRHHKDHNRFNNNPNNLVWMNGADHMKYHQSVIMETIWYNPEENIKKITKGINEYISNLSEEDRISRGEQSKLNSINSRDKAIETFNNNTNKKEIIINRGKSISVSKSTKEFKEKFSEIAKTNWGSDEYRSKVFSKKQTLTFTNELYIMFFEMFKLYGKADLTLNELNKSDEFMNEFINSNKDIRSSLTNLNEFTHKHLEKMLKEKGFKNYRDWCKVTAEELGYKNVRAWRYFIEKNNKEKSLLYNHKIISIEWLENKIDTGTITVDGNELYHNYHTFATESGVFIKNSNLDQIADIQYLQRKLFTALRVPKTFLGFEEAVGDGKNLAMQDIRFSRTINRVQQAILAELNKIAIIHLYMLGFEDELSNFNLSLNNPSTQAEMLKIEQLQAKMTLYKDAVSEAGNGFMGMSMTRARRDILGWSDEEIKKDFLEQRLEKAAASEIENTSAVIKHTGMFDEVDEVYGDINVALSGGGAGEGSEEGGDSIGGGGGGGFGGGGGLGGLETPEGGEEIPAEGGEEAPVEGGEEAPAETPEETLAETMKRTDKLLTENANKLNTRKNKYSKIYVDRLIDNINHKETIINERVAIYDKTLKINEDINGMINDIDNMLKD
jgi:uncharacterized membrane protein YgcG